jgi:two-component system, cell cycle sensor histidine kinase and response regulator CckA
MIAPAAARSALLPDPPPQTILIVDDDAAMRMILGLTLKGFGYVVLIAEDGEQALQTARGHPEIRVILLDVVMRGLSGKELADQLSTDLPNAEVVFCSGHSPKMMKLHGLDVDSVHFMQKPCRPPELRQKIEELLSIR